MYGALTALAFRPFFLFGSLYAVLALLYWSGYQLGLIALPPYFGATQWHAHEMLFGFVAAILAGFLLTASKNWANTRGVHDRALVALLLVWLGGRVSILCSALLPPWLVALADLVFLPFLAILLWQTLSKGAKKTNFVFVLWLAVLFVANGLMHLEALGLSSQTSRTGYLLGVDTIVIIMILIGGRVIPMFTQSAVPGTKIIKRPWTEKFVLLSAVSYLLSDLVDETSLVTAIAAILAGTASLVRLAGWRSLSTVGRPILWVLHLGYTFLAFGLIARGLALSVFPVRTSIPLHLLTAGAMGMLILGMMSRVSLGHTGRPLIVSTPIAIAYWLVFLGTIVRVGVPLFLPNFYIEGIAIAAAIWALGFAFFVFVYWPILTRPRIDGLEG